MAGDNLSSNRHSKEHSASMEKLKFKSNLMTERGTIPCSTCGTECKPEEFKWRPGRMGKLVCKHRQCKACIAAKNKNYADKERIERAKKRGEVAEVVRRASSSAESHLTIEQLLEQGFVCYCGRCYTNYRESVDKCKCGGYIRDTRTGRRSS